MAEVAKSVAITVTFIILIGGFGVLIAYVAGAFSSDKVIQRPHIIFVLADDFGYNDIGYHADGSQIKTPYMDELAEGGIKLENYYVQPICSPTRSQLLSGRYQIHTGLQHGVIEPPAPYGLPLDSPTLADKLKEAGYDTHMVGKWHLGFYKEEYTPWKRGFDTFYGMLLGAGGYFTHDREFNNTMYLDLRANEVPDPNQNNVYSTHLFTNKAIETIRSHDPEKPLFLYMAYQAVHGPLEVPSEYMDQYSNISDINRRTYAGMVSALDEGIMNLTQALKDSGHWDNTVFVFSSDNGGNPGRRQNNWPLRGRKNTLWEGGMKVAGFVTGGMVSQSGMVNDQLGMVSQSGMVNDQLIHISDWFPTLIGLAGGNLDGTKPLDGVDQWNAIINNTASPRKVLLHNIDPLELRRGVPLYNDTFDTSVSAAIRDGDLKLITGDPGDGTWFPPPEANRPNIEANDDENKNVWLFNITADPLEQNDLSDVRPDDVRRLLDMLQVFNATSVPALNPPFDPQSDPGLLGGVWGPWA